MLSNACENWQSQNYDIDLVNYYVISQFAEARRSQQIEQLTKDRKHQHAHQMMEWKKRYLEKQNETTRRAHEDSLKHLQVIFQGL